MSGTRGFRCYVLIQVDVLEMSGSERWLVEWCDMCMCLARGGVGGEGGEWMRELGLGFTNPVGTGGVFGRVSVFWLRWCVWDVGRGLGPGSGAVGWCYVCMRCESGFSV